MLRLGTTLLSVAAICCAPFAALAAATTLSPQTIKSIFGTGVPFQSTTPGGIGFTLVLKPDGTASRTPKGSTVPVTGTWHVDAKGYCSKWGKNSENCYTIRQDANRYSVIDSTGQAIAIWVPPVPAAPAVAKPAMPKPG